MKKCNKCNVIKGLHDFYYRKDSNKYRNSCKSCVKNRVKKYSENNPEKVQMSQHNTYMKKQKYYIKKARKWEINNKDRKRFLQKRYYRLNINKCRIQSAKNEAKRRATKLNATPPWADLNKIAIIYEKAKWLESITGLKYAVDHIIPLQGKNVSGLHIWENLQILERSINCSKGNKTGGIL